MNRLTKNTMGMFDCVKGLVVLYAIIAHCYMDVIMAHGFAPIPGSRLLLNLPGITMGALLLCSGYGFKPIKSKKILKNQFTLLIKPVFFIYLLGILIRIPLNLATDETAFNGALPRILGVLLGLTWNGSYHGIEVYSIQILWFTASLFMDWLLLTGIFRLFQKESFRALSVLLLTLLGLFLARKYSVLPFCIEQSLLSLGYIYAGYLMKKHNLMFRKIPVWAVCIMAVWSVYCLVFGDVNIGTCVVKLGLFDLLGMLCAAFLGLRVYLLIFDPDFILYRPFMYCGKNSLMLLFLHSFEHVIFEWNHFAWLEQGNHALMFILLSAIRIAGILLMLRLLQQFRMYMAERKRRKTA